MGESAHGDGESTLVSACSLVRKTTNVEQGTVSIVAPVGETWTPELLLRRVWNQDLGQYSYWLRLLNPRDKHKVSVELLVYTESTVTAAPGFSARCCNWVNPSLLGADFDLHISSQDWITTDTDLELKRVYPAPIKGSTPEYLNLWSWQRHEDMRPYLSLRHCSYSRVPDYPGYPSAQVVSQTSGHYPERMITTTSYNDGYPEHSAITLCSLKTGE